MSMNFMQKLLQQLADRYIVDKLANSKTFQSAAMKLVKSQEELKKTAGVYNV
jgi:hypothetical protein